MFKALRVPERVFSLTMWILSLAFAGFLIGLGGKLVGDLPRLDSSITQEQFADRALLVKVRGEIAAQSKATREIEQRLERLRRATANGARPRSCKRRNNNSPAPISRARCASSSHAWP